MFSLLFLLGFLDQLSGGPAQRCGFVCLIYRFFFNILSDYLFYFTDSVKTAMCVRKIGTLSAMSAVSAMSGVYARGSFSTTRALCVDYVGTLSAVLSGWSHRAIPVSACRQCRQSRQWGQSWICP